LAGLIAVACRPPEAGRRGCRAEIDQLKADRRTKLARNRCAHYHGREPAPKIKDRVKNERDKGEQGQNPDPLTNLLEEIRRKR